ncbi:MAG: MBL fold metallo-hydrolase [Clostridia bacterium]|nr:MBL fold metallo-hydrolase [Clostridia bacterium]
MKPTGWLIALLAVLTLFCGCRKDGGPPDNTTAITTPAQTTALAPATVDLVADGTAQYVIVRPEDGTQEEIDAAGDIRSLIEQQTGAAPRMTTDFVKRGQAYDSAAMEILLGRCGQPETAEVLSTLGYGQYAIRVVGSKIVVTAWSTEGFSAALEEFKTILTQHSAKHTLSLPADLSIAGTGNAMADQIPLYSGGAAKEVIDCADDNRMVYITDTTAEEFKAYCDTLTSSGKYTLYTTHAAADNRFATYTGESYTIHTYFTADKGETRIIIEPAAALPPRAEDTTTANDKYEPAVRMVGLEYNYSGDEYNQIGLMLIFRLPDGRLIVVDGGGCFDTNAALLYRHMKELAPDGNNITVAAWVLTHAHGDHTGGFVRFVRDYAAKVKVERVICNFTADSQYQRVNDFGRHDEARTCAEQIGDAVIKAHTGQVYHFGGASMEILYTFDDYEPRALTNHNATSLVFRLSMGGQTVLVLGDVYTTASVLITEMYGDYLKSDIVQVTHHGYQGGTVPLYTCIDAETAIWPGGKRNYVTLNQRQENQFLIQNTRDLFIAADDVYTLTLPYTPVGNNTKFVG